jgi:putative membrane protein
MIRKSLTLAAVAALGFGAVASVPFDPSSRAEAQRRGPGRAADLQYVAMAGASDMYEIESSRLALQRSQRADVREFAQMMIDHHTRTTQTVSDAARRDGLMPPPPRLMPAQRTMLRQLERTRGGAAFDRAYLNQQLTAHQQALALHRNRARIGRGALSQAAATAVPIVQQHISRLRQISRGR